MIEVNYNEYKETIAQNMKLIVENHDLKQEIERLNNIINELEKFINEEYRYYDKRNYPTFGACMGALNRVKDKLHELKGVDKNE